MNSLTSQLDTVLALCPGCGGDSTRVIGGPGTAGGQKFWVGCDYCRWRTWGDTEADAIATWNSRAAVGGEAVAWYVGNDNAYFYIHKEAAETEAAKYGLPITPLYASPPATVDVVALKGLMRDLMQRAKATRTYDTAEAITEARALEGVVDKLDALIGEKA